MSYKKRKTIRTTTKTRLMQSTGEQQGHLSFQSAKLLLEEIEDEHDVWDM